MNDSVCCDTKPFESGIHALNQASQYELSEAFGHHALNESCIYHELDAAASKHHELDECEYCKSDEINEAFKHNELKAS